jgi:hypothetical protein
MRTARVSTVKVTVSLSPLSVDGSGGQQNSLLARGSELDAQERFEQELLCTFSDRWEW